MSPNLKILDTTSLHNMMWVRLGAYYYITQAIEGFFEQCRIELGSQQVPFSVPNLSVTFQVSENYWLQMDQAGPYNLNLMVQLPYENSPINIQAALATGTMVLAVQDPMKLVTAENSPEYSLFKFFQVKSSQVAQTPTETLPESTYSNKGTISPVKPESSLVYNNFKYGFTIRTIT